MNKSSEMPTLSPQFAFSANREHPGKLKTLLFMPHTIGPPQLLNARGNIL